MLTLLTAVGMVMITDPNKNIQIGGAAILFMAAMILLMIGAVRQTEAQKVREEELRKAREEYEGIKVFVQKKMKEEQSNLKT